MKLPSKVMLSSDIGLRSQVLVVFEYLNDGIVVEYMTEICNNIRAQFVIIDEAYLENTGGQIIELVGPWDE